MFTTTGGATDQRPSSVDAPPHDSHRRQQTNHRARCRGGGGVTQIRVAALEGKTGNLKKMNAVEDQCNHWRGFKISATTDEGL